MPFFPQEEELLWQLCNPKTVEDANFYRSMLSNACMPSLRAQYCVCAHQFSHLLCGMIREEKLGKGTLSSPLQFCVEGAFSSDL